MAYCKKIMHPSEAVEKIVVVEVPVPPTYQLTLTQREAETLAMIGWKVGGDPDQSRRGDVDQIMKALASADVLIDVPTVFDDVGRSCGLRFKNEFPGMKIASKASNSYNQQVQAKERD